MKYNDIYLRMAFLNDLRQLRLDRDALTETVLLRVHYNKGIREFEAQKQDLVADQSADDEVRRQAVRTAADEDCPAVSDRRFTREAFRSIVAAAMDAEGGLASFMAPPAAEGEPAPLLPADVWLEQFAEVMVREN